MSLPVCPECDGVALLIDWSVPPDVNGDQPETPCPACGGSGVDIKGLREAIEAADIHLATDPGSAWAPIVAAAKAYRDLLANGQREWYCEYPEFNDPHCQSGMGNPQPDKTRQPRKHTQCRWVLLVDYPKEAENE